MLTFKHRQAVAECHNHPWSAGKRNMLGSRMLKCLLHTAYLQAQAELRVLLLAAAAAAGAGAIAADVPANAAQQVDMQGLGCAAVLHVILK